VYADAFPSVNDYIYDILPCADHLVVSSLMCVRKIGLDGTPISEMQNAEVLGLNEASVMSMCHAPSGVMALAVTMDGSQAYLMEMDSGVHRL